MPTCTNCGADVPRGARFCPLCAAPVAADVAAVTAPDEPPTPRPRWERVLFAVVLSLLLATVTLVVLVVVFGLFVDSSGL